MKKILVLSSLLVISVPTFAKVRLVHSTCSIAVVPTYTSDGLNTILTSAANEYLSKKGYQVLDFNDAPADLVLGLKLDLQTEVDEKKGKCKAILSLSDSLVEDSGSMLLANIAKGKGKLATVASKCIKGVVKAIKQYPECSTVLDPDQAPDPVPTDPAPTPPDSDTESLVPRA